MFPKPSNHTTAVHKKANTAVWKNQTPALPPAPFPPNIMMLYRHKNTPATTKNVEHGRTRHVTQKTPFSRKKTTTAVPHLRRSAALVHSLPPSDCPFQRKIPAPLPRKLSPWCRPPSPPSRPPAAPRHARPPGTVLTPALGRPRRRVPDKRSVHSIQIRHVGVRIKIMSLVRYRSLHKFKLKSVPAFGFASAPASRA